MVEVTLSPQERDALLGSNAGLELVPVSGSSDRWRLRATDKVGLLKVGDLVVEVTPKLPVDRLLFLLGYAGGVPELQNPMPRAREAPDLLEAMAWIYSEALRQALSRGLPHGYLQVEEDSIAVRGRILFEEQIRRRPGSWLPIAVRYDDFTEDIEINRLLKAALRRLLLLPLRQRTAVRDLRRWLRVFAAVSDLPLGSRDLPEPRLSRLEAHLEPAVAIATIIMRGGSIEPTFGTTRSPSLMLDLSGLFERFVRESLRQELGLDPARFPAAGGKNLYLDHGRAIELRPDLLWREGGRFLFVGDVKYKHAGDGRGRRDDLYQLLTYVVRLGLDRGTLIYATSQERRVHRVQLIDRHLEVVGLDLAEAPKDILRQVHALAVTVRAGAVRDLPVGHKAQ